MKKITLSIFPFLLPVYLFSACPFNHVPQMSTYHSDLKNEIPDNSAALSSAECSYCSIKTEEKRPIIKKNQCLYLLQREFQKTAELNYYLRPWYTAYDESIALVISHFLELCFDGYDNKRFLKIYTILKEIPSLIDHLVNDTYPSPFFWAVINGNFLMTSTLMPYVKLENPFNKSALFYAVLLQRKKITKLLLNNRFHPDTPAVRYHPHLDSVLRAKTMKTFLLIEPKATWKTYAPLKAAILNNDTTMVSLLLSKGATEKDSVESTLLPKTTKKHIITLLKKYQLLS